MSDVMNIRSEIVTQAAVEETAVKFAAGLRITYGNRIRLPATETPTFIRSFPLLYDGVPIRECVWFDLERREYVAQFDALVWPESTDAEIQFHARAQFV